MAYCKNCGAQIDDMAVMCPKCGAPQQNMNMQQTNVVDSGSAGWAVLGFCIPLVGLILYLVWKDTKPMSSKMAGKGALISVIVSVAFYVLAFLIGIAGSM